MKRIVLSTPRPLGRESASPTHGSLWPYCERSSSDRSKGGPWGSQGFRVTSQCRGRQQSASCASFKSAGETARLQLIKYAERLGQSMIERATAQDREISCNS